MQVPSSFSGCPVDTRYIAGSIWEGIEKRASKINLSENKEEAERQLMSLIDTVFHEIQAMDNSFVEKLEIDDLPTIPSCANEVSDISQVLAYKEAAQHLIEFNYIEHQKLTEVVYLTTLLKNTKNSLGKNILHVALDRKDLPMLKLVIAVAPELLNSRVQGKTPLHFAVINGCSLEIIDWLTTKSVLLFPPNSKGVPIDANEQDEEGNTPLHYALQLNYRSIAYKLKDDLKANLDIENQLGLTPAEMAIQSIYVLTLFSNEHIPDTAANADKPPDQIAINKAMNGPAGIYICSLKSLALAFSSSKGLDEIPSSQELFRRVRELSEKNL